MQTLQLNRKHFLKIWLMLLILYVIRWFYLPCWLELQIIKGKKHSVLPPWTEEGFVVLAGMMLVKMFLTTICDDWLSCKQERKRHPQKNNNTLFLLEETFNDQQKSHEQFHLLTFDCGLSDDCWNETNAGRCNSIADKEQKGSTVRDILKYFSSCIFIC